MMSHNVAKMTAQTCVHAVGLAIYYLTILRAVFAFVRICPSCSFALNSKDKKLEEESGGKSHHAATTFWCPQSS
jgi:hypothetical protein